MRRDVSNVSPVFCFQFQRWRERERERSGGFFDFSRISLDDTGRINLVDDVVQKPWNAEATRVCVCACVCVSIDLFDIYRSYSILANYSDTSVLQRPSQSDWISRATRFLVDHSNFTIYKIRGTRDSSLNSQDCENISRNRFLLSPRFLLKLAQNIIKYCY